MTVHVGGTVHVVGMVYVASPTNSTKASGPEVTMRVSGSSSGTGFDGGERYGLNFFSSHGPRSRKETARGVRGRKGRMAEVSWVGYVCEVEG